MPIGFVKALFDGNDKTAGTSFQLTGSLSVALGNTIFVAFGADTGGMGHTCEDNLGNTYTQVHAAVFDANCEARLFKATVTNAGTLTTQTISWTNNVTAKAGASGEYSGNLVLRSVSDRTTTASIGAPCININGITLPKNALIVCAGAQEQNDPPLACPLTTFPSSSLGTLVGGNNTIGQGATSNIGAALGHGLNDGTSRHAFAMSITFSDSADCAGVSAVYYDGDATEQQSWGDNGSTNDAAIGSVAWGAPNETKSENNSRSAVTLTAGQTSNYLKTAGASADTECGFKIPSEATIVGLLLEVDCKTQGGASQNLSARLVKAGTVQTAETKTASIPLTEAYLSFGSASDLWSNSWTPSDINHANFGWVVWVDNAAAETYEVDHMRLLVTFVVGGVEQKIVLASQAVQRASNW